MGTFWAQVAAQAICFIIFFWVLRRYAWGPVLQFLEERRDRIKGQFDEVEELKRQTQTQQAELKQRLDKIEDEARKRVQEAVMEGRKSAEAIAERARADATEIRAHAKMMCEIEFAKAMQQVKDDVVRMTITVAERLMREKMDDARHRQMVSGFLDELGKN